MKKIIFGLQTMVLGGVEKELITVIKKMDPSKYDITVLVLYIEDTEIMKELPSYVKIINLNVNKKYYCSGLINICLERIKKGKLLEAFELFVKRLLRKGMTHSNIDISEIKNVDIEYDIAVCYHMHSPLMIRYVSEKIISKKKIAWIHNDFITTNYPVQKLIRYLNVYDEIVGVSKRVTDEFISLCNEYNGEVSVAYNMLDCDEIREKSLDNVDEELDENKVIILTIGRFTEQKGIEYAIKATKILKDNNKCFHWYLIGYGELEDKYKKMILELDVEGYFTILGRKNNPYPYIKLADVYVQPSKHEAYPLTVKEAKILNKPIICMDFAGADELINNGVDGYIVPIGNVEKLAEVIECLINNQEERMKLSNINNGIDDEEEFNNIVKHFEK